MNIDGVSQTGTEMSLVQQKLMEASQGAQPKTEKEKEASERATDTVDLLTKAIEKPAMEFASLDEEEAGILAQLVAENLTNQAFGISTPAGTDVLRTFM